MKHIDITPAEFRCPSGDCPSVKRAEDGGTYKITGAWVQTAPDSKEATVEIDAALLEGALFPTFADQTTLPPQDGEIARLNARIAALETALKELFDAAYDDGGALSVDLGQRVQAVLNARVALSKDTGHE